ncbi:hypothetical protein [Caballeronia sp. BR00000012568055]|uniref:hypothetical protein n=1 Tax=Caballeronia sp. BR00000012568055 TaxID=2918761 RepID=UPI0023F90AE7|nr:hypothetical protein [Caballeronia sp. BR00000012568055]
MADSINKKQSSKAMTALAEKTIHDPHASKIAKSLAGSVISQRNTTKQTGVEMETKAAKVLKSNKYAEETRELAGSVVAQANKNRKGK